jgi:hypothetical protein
MRTWASLIPLFFFALYSPSRLSAQSIQTASNTAQDLKRLTIEELAQIDVTSVSRRSEKLADTAAAVSVINPDRPRIRRRNARLS